MDPLARAQVLLLCNLCQRAALQSHCELCQINLCKDCVGDHLSDSSQRHNVVPYKHRTSIPNYPDCPNHSTKHCELHCEKCDIPVCTVCISSDKHHGHKFTDVLEKISSKQKDLERDLEELEKQICPVYDEITLDLNTEKENLENDYEKLKTSVTKQGEDWHRKINTIVNKRKSEIEEMKNKHLSVLDEQGKEIKQIIFDVKQSILDLKEILKSNDVSLTSAYRSRNDEFRSLPPKLNVSLPIFSPYRINTEQLHQMFGSLSAIFITKERHGYTMNKTEAVSCPTGKPLFYEPELMSTIRIRCRILYSATCLSDGEIWTCGNEKIMNLFNLQGELLKSVPTKYGNNPRDIAVTRSGDLVYTAHGARTVNIVNNQQIQEVIRVKGWKALCVCSASSGDLLVTMISDDEKESKVVRYSGSTEKQSIQFDDNGKPLFLSGYCKYISENRNLDICVADNTGKAVVVVNQAGKLRFRYIGRPPATRREFKPCGITTDSQSQILTADLSNHCIHILDQDGHFLHYIGNCDLHDPWGLCVDSRDNLFVAEHKSSKVKKIKYM